MNSFLAKIRQFLKGKTNILIIILAVLMLLVVSFIRHYYTHEILEKELVARAENELILKAIVVKSTLRMADKTVQDNMWDFNRNLQNPDSMYSTLERMYNIYPYMLGCGIAFLPDHYPQKGRLFEPYVTKKKGQLVRMQLASDQHDYTTMDFFTKPLENDSSYWADPYRMGVDDDDPLITTLARPIYGDDNKPYAVCGVDVSLKWLGDTLNVQHMYPSSFNMLLTQGGNIIVKPSDTPKCTYNAERIAALINDSTVARTQTPTGRSKLIRFYDENKDDYGTIFYAFMRGKPHWQMVVVCYDSEVYESLYQMRTNMQLLTFLACSVLGFILFRYMRADKRLRKAGLEQERISGELNVATTIQMSMLPEKGGTRVTHPDMRVFGTLIPAKEVGGDLYEFFVRDEKLFFCIGDVSGKGVPSALIMAVTQSLFRSSCSRESNPVYIMRNINEASCRNNSTNMFVTLFVGVLDLPTGKLRYCNAGHDAPFIISPNGEVSLIPAKANIPVGLFDNYKYEMQSMIMAPNSTIFLYTDGLTEARNHDREQYGMQRAMQQLKEMKSASPEQMVKRMTEQVNVFANNVEQSDDLTMMAINYVPKRDVCIMDKELLLTNQVTEVTRLNQFVKEIAETLDFEKSKTRNIKLAVEEMVVNVINYAYASGTKGEIMVRAVADHNHLKFIISDKGKAFDPTTANVSDTTLSVEERPIGGLGILLVRQLVDSVNYERIDGKNILTLKINR